MARYEYVILTVSHPGMEEEFQRWYDEVHVPDVLKVPGVVSCTRYQPVLQLVRELQVPQWNSVAIYTIEAEDPEAVITAIKARAGTPEMAISDALDYSGNVQILCRQVA